MRCMWKFSLRHSNTYCNFRSLSKQILSQIQLYVFHHLTQKSFQIAVKVMFKQEKIQTRNVFVFWQKEIHIQPIFELKQKKKYYFKLWHLYLLWLVGICLLVFIEFFDGYMVVIICVVRRFCTRTNFFPFFFGLQKI